MSSSSGVPKKPNQDPSYELGDLELAPRPSLQQRDRPAPGDGQDLDDLTNLPDRRAAMPDNDLGTHDFAHHHDLDELHGPTGFGLDDDDRSFELDLPEGVRPADGRPSVATQPKPSLPQNSLPPRSSRSPRASNPADEARAARELAGYGDPREGFGAPGYVLRVVQRWLQLYLARRDVEQRASDQADQYEKALRDLGRALLEDPAVTTSESLRERVLLVETRQGELKRAQQATEHTRTQHEDELRALQAKREAAEADLAPYLEAEKKAESTHAALDRELQRKRARLQRSEIELRALTRASVPPPPERVQNVEAERAKQQAELDTLQAELEAAAAALSRAQRELSLRRAPMNGLEREAQQHRRTSQAKHDELDQEVAKAEHALSAVLCGLAEAADALGLAHSANEQVAGLRTSEEALDDIVAELAKYDRALTIYDRDALLKGSLMWAGFIIALAVVVKLL